MKFSVISIICSVLLSVVSAENEKPNVVFILSDDMGYGDLSCYGAKNFKTPACDRLANEGMRFTDAHSPSAVCTPTRYSILTGRYAWRSWLKNWVLQEGHPLLIDTDRLTMGKIFQQAGYHTGCIGKWHLGWGEKTGTDFSGEVKPGPLEVGFDEFYGVPFSHNSGKALQVYVKDRRIVGLPDGVSYRDKEAQNKTVRSLEETATELSKEAVAFIERNKDKPFFLFYPTTNIHFPLTPHPRFKGKTNAGTYGEFMIEFDWAVGEVLDALDRLDLAENTIVIVTSDNGGRPPGSAKEKQGYNNHQCNGSWRGTKRTIYEAGHRVPLIVRWPGHVKAGSVSSETVCLTDFYATFAQMLKQPIPQNAGEDSYDITAVLKGLDYSVPIREATVHHSVSGQFAIRKGDWKLIEGSGDGDFPRKQEGGIDVKNWNVRMDEKTGKPLELEYFQLEPDGKYQLYDLGKDPTESNDVSEVFPNKVEELKILLEKYRTEDRSVTR